MMVTSKVLAPTYQSYKQRRREEILTMIDIALDTKDEQWFKELKKQLDSFSK